VVWETNTEIRAHVRRESRQPGNCWRDEKKMHTQGKILSVRSIYGMVLSVKMSNLACDCGTEFVTEFDRYGENGKRGTVGKTVGGEPRSLSPCHKTDVCDSAHSLTALTWTAHSWYERCGEGKVLLALHGMEPKFIDHCSIT
jgi:hypothetical protein